MILVTPVSLYLPIRSALSFFFNDTATTEIYTLSLHDALPISPPESSSRPPWPASAPTAARKGSAARSEEHTSELQSHSDLVCRLLLEKKKKKKKQQTKTKNKIYKHKTQLLY